MMIKFLLFAAGAVQDTGDIPVKDKMDAREFPPPNIPKTPSRTINSMLETRCNRTFENRFKAAPAYVVCGVFQAITQVYTLIMTKTNKVSG